MAKGKRKRKPVAEPTEPVEESVETVTDDAPAPEEAAPEPAQEMAAPEPAPVPKPVASPPPMEYVFTLDEHRIASTDAKRCGKYCLKLANILEDKSPRAAAAVEELRAAAKLMQDASAKVIRVDQMLSELQV